MNSNYSTIQRLLGNHFLATPKDDEEHRQAVEFLELLAAQERGRQVNPSSSANFQQANGNLPSEPYIQRSNPANKNAVAAGLRQNADTSGASDGPDEDDKTYASAGRKIRDYLGSGHASMNRRNAVKIPSGNRYIEVEITLSPLGSNLGWGRKLPKVGKKIPKANDPGMHLEILNQYGDHHVDESFKAGPGEVVVKKFDIHPSDDYTVLINPVGSAPWDYIVYAHNYYSDMPER